MSTSPVGSSEKSGCFSWSTIASLFNPTPKADKAALATADAFVLNASLLSPGNRAFYEVLVTVIPPSAVVFAEVSLAAVFDAKKGTGRQGARNRINQKSVDFVVCDRASMKPLCAIEVDDRTHARADRTSRDEMVNALFDFHHVPLIHVTGAMSYRADDVRRQLASVFPQAT